METNAITPKKTAIVTGGSRGIGRSTVESLAKRGVNTIFTYHTHGTDAEAVVATVKDAGAKAIALQLDAGDAASFDAFVESVNDALANLFKTRGQDGFATSFPVGLLRPLQHFGLAGRTPVRRRTRCQFAATPLVYTSAEGHFRN
jgi:NAD(P)-dependent dehydrogenase (short-subunit alcohol dehydrogenase family)